MFFLLYDLYQIIHSLWLFLDWFDGSVGLLIFDTSATFGNILVIEKCLETYGFGISESMYFKFLLHRANANWVWVLRFRFKQT